MSRRCNMYKFLCSILIDFSFFRLSCSQQMKKIVSIFLVEMFLEMTNLDFEHFEFYCVTRLSCIITDHL